MIDLQNVKYVPVIKPGVIVDNDDFVGARGDGAPIAIDTAGWDYAMIVVQLGATDIAIADMGLFEYDTDTPASATEIAAAAFDATGNPGLPADDDDNKAAVWFVDLRKTKRYIYIDLTAGNGTAGTYAAAFAVLSRGAEAPTTAATRGFDLGQVII